VCRKGNFVTKEIIAEALWPELDKNKSSPTYIGLLFILKDREKVRSAAANRINKRQNAHSIGNGHCE
jgi:hypothetical protein